MKWYPKARESALGGGINVVTGSVKAVLVTSSYTQSDAHQYLSDVASGSRLGTSGALSSKTTTSGTFDAADPSITAAAAGTGVAVIFFIDTGTESTSPLLIFDDKDADGTTALNRPVVIGDVVTVNIHASGIADL